MQRSSVSWLLLLCFALLLLLAGFGQVRGLEPSAPDTPPSSSSDSLTLDGISETLTSKLETLKARLIERSKEAEQLKAELSSLQAVLSETSSSLQRLRDSLTSTSDSFENYRRAAESTIESQAQEIRKLRVLQWVERAGWLAAVTVLIYFLST